MEMSSTRMDRQDHLADEAAYEDVAEHVFAVFDAVGRAPRYAASSGRRDHAILELGTTLKKFPKNLVIGSQKYTPS